MLLGLALDAWSGADVKLPVARVQLAERLGYDSVWTAEAYGADALTPLAYLAASTSRIKLATGVVQISARTPAATAMAFATLEALAGTGRVIAGLGLSGPQIVEGWYGQPWAKPIARTRDYVAIMRKVFRREGAGRARRATRSRCRTRAPTRPGWASRCVRSCTRTRRCPIYLAAGGPANVALAAEVADGWIPMGLSPANAAEFRATLEKGAARSGRDARHARDPGVDHRAPDRRRRGHDRDDEAARRAVRRRDGCARSRTSTRTRWRGAATPTRPNGSRSCSSRAGATTRPRRSPTSTSTRARCSARPNASRSDSCPWTECGITGLTIHADQDEAIELMADLAAPSRQGSTT